MINGSNSRDLSPLSNLITKNFLHRMLFRDIYYLLFIINFKKYEKL